MVKIPESIKIVGLTYSIGDLRNGDQLEFYGRALHREQSIELDPNLAVERKLITLWHEIFHAADVQVSLLDEDKEKAADRFALVVHAVLADNPGLVELYRDKEVRDMGCCTTKT